MANKTLHFEGLTSDVVEVLAWGEFPVEDRDRFNKFLDDIHHDRVLAVLEYPSIDIELEIYTADGYEVEDATATDNSIAPSYFVCTKGLYHGEEMWESDDYAGDCYVDFTDPNWRDLLEQEMDERLADYVKRHGYSYDRYNWEV